MVSLFLVLSYTMQECRYASFLIPLVLCQFSKHNFDNCFPYLCKYLYLYLLATSTSEASLIHSKVLTFFLLISTYSRKHISQTMVFAKDFCSGRKMSRLWVRYVQFNAGHPEEIDFNEEINISEQHYDECMGRLSSKISSKVLMSHVCRTHSGQQGTGFHV